MPRRSPPRIPDARFEGGTTLRSPLSEEDFRLVSQAVDYELSKIVRDNIRLATSWYGMVHHHEFNSDTVSVQQHRSLDPTKIARRVNRLKRLCIRLAEDLYGGPVPDKVWNFTRNSWKNSQEKLNKKPPTAYNVDAFLHNLLVLSGKGLAAVEAVLQSDQFRNKPNLTPWEEWVCLIVCIMDEQTAGDGS